MNVQLFIENQSGQDHSITLCDNGKWAGNLQGRFMASPDCDYPVNNLLLVMEKGENPDQRFVDKLQHEAKDEGSCYTLLINEGADQPERIPLRSIEYGENSISFYRQSEHQSLSTH